jgi:F-type H+-transporting ATPase subunit alpha
MIWAMQKGFFDDVAVEDVKTYQNKLQDYLTTRKEDLLNTVRDKKQFDETIEKELTTALEEFKKYNV